MSSVQRAMSSVQRALQIIAALVTILFIVDIPEFVSSKFESIRVLF